MRPLRILASLTLTVALLANATPAGALAYRRIDAVSFADENHGWISGGRQAPNGPPSGFVSYTEDGGQSWRTTVTPLRWLYGLENDGTSSGWALAETHDYAYRSIDGGANWTEKGPILGSGTDSSLQGALKLGSRIVVFGQNKGQQIGQPAVIASSSNGGDTWTKNYEGPAYAPADEYSDPPSTYAEFVSGDSADGTVAWIAGTEYNGGSGADLSSITFKTPLIFKTSNGGSTWDTQTVGALTTGNWPITSLAAGSATTAFAGTNSRILLRTVNGSTWDTFKLPRRLPYNPIGRALDAYGENILVAGGTGGFLAWSNNAKLAPPDSAVVSDWTYRTLPGSPNINSVQVLSPTTAIAVGDEETIAKTTDAGQNWTLMPAGPPSAIISAPGAGFPLTLAPITIQGTAQDVGVGVEKVEIRIRRADGRSYDGVDWTTADTWLSTETSNSWDTWSRTWTPDAGLLASGQMVTITARATDGAGLSALSADRTSGAPMSASVTLAGGAPFTTDSTVTASIVANGATHMRWKVGSGAFNAWQPYATSANVYLGTGDSEKTVTFEFSTDGTTTATVAFDSITLHTSVPSIGITTPAQGFGTTGLVSITGTATDAGAAVSAVHVRIRRASGESWNGSAWVSSDSWLPATATSAGYATWSYDWTPSGLNGEIATIQARATDAANLTSTTAGVSSASGLSASVSLDGGAAFTSSTDLYAAITAPGATDMRWRVDGGAFGAWQAFSGTAAISLTSGDGTKTVDFEFSTDGGSTIAASASDGIVLHTTLPDVALTGPAAGFPLTLAPVAVTGTAADTAGVSNVKVLVRRADGKSWNGVAWDSGENWLPVSSSNGFATWSYSWLPGLHAIDPGDLVTLSARATDSFGLSKVSPTVTSGVPARASVIVNRGETYVTTRTVGAALTVPDYMTSMRYKVSGEATSSWTTSSLTPTVTINGSEGTKTVTFQFSSNGVDVAAEATSLPIFMDLSKPAVAISAPSANFDLAVTSRQIQGTASDAGSGIGGVEVRIRRGDQYWTGLSWQGTEVWLPASVNGGTWAYTWAIDQATSSGHLPVTVSARAADRAGNNDVSNSVTSTDPLDPTAVALTSTSKTLSYGGTGTVSGTLKLLGEPLPSTQVILRSGTSSTTLKDTTARAITNSLGQFSFSVKPSVKTYYQVRFAQTATRAGSSSGVIAFTPKAYVTRPYAPLTARRTTAFTSYGYLKPKHAAGTYPVRIYLYRYVNGSWRYYRYVSAKASSVSTYTKYSASVRLPYAGKWRIRAYHSDRGHAATWSTYRYVTVR